MDLLATTGSIVNSSPLSHLLLISSSPLLVVCFLSFSSGPPQELKVFEHRVSRSPDPLSSSNMGHRGFALEQKWEKVPSYYVHVIVDNLHVPKEKRPFMRGVCPG